ncbi:MarR family winged helix-turn-helix transcriptional regulator [Actinomadura sp. 9N407]|uniref:MarR family winged helix-turn-helix transcriptional regulator n=1 Tax=Actinomadura sp. 9N407 TaxID=3375154 RepID=UPI0037AD50F0
MATDTEVWGQIVTLHARVVHELAPVMQRRHGIGLSAYWALCRLAEAEDGELRMQELADLIGLDQSSVSRLVARLAVDGLTERTHCPKDRRGVYTVITEEGRAVQAKARATYEATLTEALDAAAADERLGPAIASLRG